MALFDEHKTEVESSEKRKTTDYTGVIIVAILAPVFFFFCNLGDPHMALAVTIYLGMNLLAIRLRWELRKCFWFWLTIVLVLPLQVLLLLLIPWPHTTNRITLLPIGVAVLLITLGAVRFVETFIVKYVPPDEED
jgi:hypothetical protein